MFIKAVGRRTEVDAPGPGFAAGATAAWRAICNGRLGADLAEDRAGSGADRGKPLSVSAGSPPASSRAMM